MPAATPLTWMILLSLGLIWGGSFLGVELALEGYAPFTLAAGRIVIGALAILAIAFAVGAGLPGLRTAVGRRIWLCAFGMGLLSNALPFTLLSWGQQQVTSGFAGVTMACVPLLVLPLAHVFVPGDRLTWTKGLGFSVGFVGVVILIGPASILSGEDAPLARIACIAAACCYAFGGIVTRRAPPCPLLSLSAAALLCAALMMVPLALLLEGVPRIAGPVSTGALLYLGLLPTALATLLLVHVIKVAGPSFLSLVNYQVPIWAAVLGAVVLAEPVPPQMILALGLVLAGMVIAQGQWRRRQA
ncbi:MAG: DMT family transporter [Pseudomonadota bacterium]